ENGNKLEFSGTRELGEIIDNRTISDFQKEHGLGFKSKLIGWSSLRCKDNSIYDGYNYLNGDPAKVSQYASGGTLYSPSYEVDASYSGNRNFYALWCPENADAYVFLGEARDRDNINKEPRYFRVSNVSFKLAGVVVRRNASFDVGLINEPSKQGYQFKGWVVDGEDKVLTAGSLLNCKNEGNIKWVFPEFTPNTNKITFLDAEGNILKEETVLSGYSATAPTPPEVAGKRFKEWDKTFNNVTSDMTIKAKYEDIATITVIANGGTIKGQEIYTEDVKIGTYLHDFTKGLVDQAAREGYSTTYDKWYFYNEDGTKSTVSYSPVKDNTTVYVDWQINKYTITFDNIYGSSKGTKTITADYGTLYKDLNVPSFDPPYKYYEFLGYYTKSSNGELISPDTPVTKDVRYYAQWTGVNANVTWHYDIPDDDQTYQTTFRIGVSSSFKNYGIPE
ncbi:InlB B-repeat-containing protein, partial [Clostridium butyricum]|uniref:InlB B-repeat-containing protein n=1 Tax=Clostridium butyricum TaxID=1492 RepID=UPI00346589C2